MWRAAFIGDERLWAGGHPEGHPLRPERLRDTWEMLHAYNAFDAPNTRLIPPRMPTDDELATFHTDAYIDAVRRLSRGERDVNAAQFNFGPGDNPAFEGMYESEGLKVGSALVAADLLINDEVDAAFSFSGGLHHAGPDFVSGFCVFGDGAVAIHRLLHAGWRVAYIDIDVHHGDGVQAAFYDDPRVLTISLHESGEFLFPGTGFADEIGTGDGHGSSVNIPLLPYTDDDTYMWAFDEVVPALIEQFAADVVVAQFGVDAHWQDPLAHLHLTMTALESLFGRICDRAPRLLALGGGGYNRDVVPRAWTLAWGTLSEQTFAQELPEPIAGAYQTGTLYDQQMPAIAAREREQTREFAERTVRMLRNRLALP